jgi:parvulin-like peptidyl-prolyl isomerase
MQDSSLKTIPSSCIITTDQKSKIVNEEKYIHLPQSTDEAQPFFHSMKGYKESVIKFRVALLLLSVTYSLSFTFIPASSSLSCSLRRTKQRMSDGSRRAIHNLYMVSTDDILVSTNLRSSIPTATTTSSSTYPTARGSEVDSRKIIATAAGRKYLTAVRLAHILLLSEDMAQDCLHQLRSASINFEDLARQISNCAETRTKGGELGWICTSFSQEKDQHLDDVFPQQAREHVVHITTKPGDVVLVKSTRGYHLVQVRDVMADVQKMASFRRAKR